MKGPPLTLVSEELGRFKKAVAIADQLQVVGCGAEEAAFLGEEAWLAAAALAGCRSPSRKTREVVVGLLAQRRDAAQAYAAMSDVLRETEGTVGPSAW